MFLLVCCDATGAHKWRFDVSTSIKIFATHFCLRKVRRRSKAKQKYQKNSNSKRTIWIDRNNLLIPYESSCCHMTDWSWTVCVLACVCVHVLTIFIHKFVLLCIFHSNVFCVFFFFRSLKCTRMCFDVITHQTCMISCNCTNSSATRFLIEFNWEKRPNELGWIENYWFD